jgi:hypothetical protein
MWVLGLISQEERGRVLLFPVTSRDSATLIPLILDNVLPGTTIITDGWSSYGSLTNHEYNHLKVNHNLHFVDPQTGTNTQLIENTWLHVKKSFPYSVRASKEGYAPFLYEFCYRRMLKARYANDDHFLTFLSHWGMVVQANRVP